MSEHFKLALIFLSILAWPLGWLAALEHDWFAVIATCALISLPLWDEM